jgi:integrase
MGVKIREKIKGSGVYWAYINHHGKRKAKKIGRDKKMANEVGRLLEAKLALGDLNLDSGKDKKKITFKSCAETWLNDFIKGTRRPSTHERYGDALKRHIYPTLGNKPIDEITRADARNLLLKLYNGGLSKSMIRIFHACISGTMSYAVDEETIPANPVTGLTKRLQLKGDKEPVEPMTQEEAQRFLEICKTSNPEHYPFFICAFRTGMRLGELLGLKWGDIDWHGRFIEVKRAYKRGYMGPTKTGKARRVDMSDQLGEALRGLYARRLQESLKEGRGSEVIEAVFHWKGKPMEQNFARRIFKKVLLKAGIRDMKFHSIRHTFASHLLSDGVSPVYVKEQLGHTSIQMTVDNYGRWIPNQNRDAVNRLDKNYENTRLSATPVQPAKIEKA